jgi:hypothetical protein
MQATVLPVLDRPTVFLRMRITPPEEEGKSSFDHIATDSINEIDALQGDKDVYHQNKF